MSADKEIHCREDFSERRLIQNVVTPNGVIPRTNFHMTEKSVQDG